MRTIPLVFLFLALSCKEGASDREQPYFFTSEKQKDLKTRKDRCEAESGKYFSDSTETCLDLEQEKKRCESQKTTRWDDGLRKCLINNTAAEDLRAHKCRQKGKVYINGVCTDETP